MHNSNINCIIFFSIIRFTFYIFHFFIFIHNILCHKIVLKNHFICTPSFNILWIVFSMICRVILQHFIQRLIRYNAMFTDYHHHVQLHVCPRSTKCSVVLYVCRTTDRQGYGSHETGELNFLEMAVILPICMHEGI